mgnify:FL=1
MSRPGAPHTSDEHLAEAEACLRSAAEAGPGLGGASAALVGIGFAVLGMARRQGEFYREVVDVLDNARGD